MSHEEGVPTVPVTGSAVIGNAPGEPLGEQVVATAAHTNEPPKVGARYIWLLLIALFGIYIAEVTPIAISLAIRIKQIAPDHEEYLGYVIGVAATVSLFSGPITGILSDRTRSRFGRRRPWLIAGALVGSVGLFIISVAPNAVGLGAGWVVATLGWNTAIGNATNSQADRLPESQRGKVGGLVGVVTMIAPVFGATIGGLLSTNSILLFMVPAVIGVILVLLFVLFIREDDSRTRAFAEPLNIGLVLRKFVYNPRRYPDFSWNWLGRFLFYFGLTTNSTFTAFFFAQRLGQPITAIGGFIALAGLLSVPAVIIGAGGSGFVSDRLHRRKVFVLSAAIVFSLGALLIAFAPNITLLLVGSFVTSLGLGVFSAVDQAIILDTLPERETDAGRFVGISGLANSIAQAAAPLAAPAFLGIGVAAGADKNYSLLYIVAAAFTFLGGLAILRVKSVR